MQDATSQSPNFRLAIAPAVASQRFSALLALQRAQEPETAISLREVSGGELIAGLQEGRYDAGVSFEGANHPALRCERLWTENMAVSVPLRSPLLDQAMLTISELLDYPVFRWPAEACAALDHTLTCYASAQQSIQYVNSFEMMALWVAAGYGVGLAAQSRIEHARGWEIRMRPLSDGPYELATHLLRPVGQASPAADRFKHRALQVAVAA